MRRRCAALAAVAALAAAVGCAAAPEPPPATAAPGGVLTRPYDRSQFGDGWADEDGDGCDTRDEILARDALGATVGPRGCVNHVVIIDPYTSHRVEGRAEIDIDHVVALADAWRSGAWRWTDKRRETFANDERNLLATSDDVNRAKADRGPDRWRPPSPGGWCKYAKTYAETKRIHRLQVTVAQRLALGELTVSCTP